MITLKEIKERLVEHRSELHEKFHVSSIGIFGSFARGEETALSDVDVLVAFDAPMGWEIVDLQEYLEGLLGVKVGLVTDNAARAKPQLWRIIEKELISV